jgi:hypothetical protein
MCADSGAQTVDLEYEDEPPLWRDIDSNATNGEMKTVSCGD